MNDRNRLAGIRRKVYTVPQNDWNASDTAKSVSMSVSSFQRKYKEFFGVSFAADVIESRISRAKKMLRHTDLLVKDIAEQCGYQSVQHFMRQFKEQVGMTAKEYRANHS